MHRKMIDRRRRSIVAAALGTPLWIGGVTSAAAPGSNFRVYDGLLHRGKPNLARLGFERIYWVGGLWRPGTPRDYVDEQGVIAALALLPYEARTLYIDIENWPLLGVSDSVRAQHIENFIVTAKIVRRVKPAVKFGFYGIAPLCIYWPIIRQDKEALAEWRAANRALQPLADLVDFVLPSLYTAYDDHADWRKYAIASLDEARQYRKPIYPFLWYEYFDGNPLLRGHVVNATDWRDELDLCRECADGIVLWGGSERGWSESAGWWQSVLSFMGKPAASPTRAPGPT